MNDKIDMKINDSLPEEDKRSANPSYYLDRVSLTILMLMKLVEGLSKLCLVVVCAFMLNTFVAGLNEILKNGSVSGKAMIAQILTTLRVPVQYIRQAVAAVPSNLTISPKLPSYLFAIFLPFVVITVLEAIALIRLRLGKGGAITMRILHWIYFLLDAVKLFALTMLALILSILSLTRLGGTLGIIFASIIFSLAVFHLCIGLPAMLYHRNIAGIMKDIRYEMKTGIQAVRRWVNFNKILGFLLALEVAGIIISIMAYWRPTKEDPAMATLIMIIAFPALKLLKYICVMFFYQNFMKIDNAVESKDIASHKPQIILVTLVTVSFVFVTAFVCAQGASVSRLMVGRMETFFNNAQQTVNRISNQADQQINAVEQEIDSQTDADGTSQSPQTETTEDSTQNTPEATTGNTDATETTDAPGTTVAPETGTEEKTK